MCAEMLAVELISIKAWKIESFRLYNGVAFGIGRRRLAKCRRFAIPD